MSMPVPKILRPIAVLLLLWIPLTLSAAENQAPTDDAIASAVSTRLFNDTGTSGYLIDVASNEGIVTLSGTASNIMAKERAARLAETVKGVRAVVNKIDVSAPLRSAKEIKEDVQSAFQVNPATDAKEIQVQVENGTVSLIGTVDSWQKKQLVARVAKGVTGVRAIDNQIDVRYAQERPDTEIEKEIEQALRWDALVDDALIEVEVKDDKVALSGHVGSAAERSRAYNKAWVFGVEEVDASNLQVSAWSREERFRRGKYADKEDVQIKQAVIDALRYDPRVASFDIDVSVEEGVVTLNGRVNNLKAKRSAAQTARHTVGVWRVINQIQVRPSTPSDATIEDRIEDALLRNPYVNRYDIAVSVENGKATLTGTVDTHFEKAQADDIVASVYGVVQVNNNLKVQDERKSLSADPYVNWDWYVYDYDWYNYPDAYTTTRTDWEIRDDINDELFWSPFVDADQITVNVEDGIATLTGTVDTWNERAAATENAYEGGAVAVNNDLRVSYGPAYYRP